MSKIIESTDKFFQRWNNASHEAYVSGFEESLAEGVLHGGVFESIVKQTVKEWITVGKGEYWVNFVDGVIGDGKSNDEQWDFALQAVSTITQIFEGKEENPIFMQLFYYTDIPILLHFVPLNVDVHLNDYLEKLPDRERVGMSVFFDMYVKGALRATLQAGFVCVETVIDEEQTIIFTFRKNNETVEIQYNQPNIYPEIEILVEAANKMKAGETPVEE